MAQTNAEDNFITSSEERLKFLRENNKLKREVEMFEKNEDLLTSQVRTLESKVDALEEERYRLMEQVSSMRCDLDMKDTECRRSMAKLNQMREQYLALEQKYQRQKEKVQKVASSEKEFYKALQEVLDYYYDSLQKYGRFCTKMLYKLMVNENVNIQNELKNEFSAKMTNLKILTGTIEIPSVKVSKTTLFRNLKQRVAFFQDIDFDKTQTAFDKLLEELKSQGVKLEIGDMTVFLDGHKTAVLSKRGSIYEENSLLNDSLTSDGNASQTLFLADLDRMDNTMSLSGAAKQGSFATLGEHLANLKSQMSAKASEGPDYQQMNRVLRDVGDFVDFLHGNFDPGQKVLSGKLEHLPSS
jgi:hypothetical protein